MASTSEIIPLAFFRESSNPYATLTPMLDPARAGFTWNNTIMKLDMWTGWIIWQVISSDHKR